MSYLLEPAKRYLDTPGYRAALFFPSAAHQRYALDMADERLSRADWSKSHCELETPLGSYIYFYRLDDEYDWAKVCGMEFHFVGFDHVDNEELIQKAMKLLRRREPPLPLLWARCGGVTAYEATNGGRA